MGIWFKGDGVSIYQIDPCSDPLWRNFVATQESSVFHSPEWIRAIAETYGFDVDAHVLLDESGRVIAGFPVCHVADMRKASFGNRSRRNASVRFVRPSVPD
jgi:hypothetical protein